MQHCENDGFQDGFQDVLRRRHVSKQFDPAVRA